MTSFYFNDIADVQNYLDGVVGISTTDDIMQVINKETEPIRHEFVRNKAIIEHYDFVIEENGNLRDALDKSKDTFIELKRLLNMPGRTPRKELKQLITLAVELIDDALED